jgi:Ca2+-binding EF-hand superfamily protein
MDKSGTGYIGVTEIKEMLHHIGVDTSDEVAAEIFSGTSEPFLSCLIVTYWTIIALDAKGTGKIDSNDFARMMTSASRKNLKGSS